MMALLTFDKYSDVTRWRETEKTAPGGLAADGLKLISSAVTYSLDSLRHAAAPEQPARGKGVFFIIPYGSVAKIGGWRNPPVSIPVTSFRAHAEEFIEEQDQSQYVPFRQPPYLAFSHHVHHLISLDRSPRPVKGSEPLAGVNPSFDRAMVLFHDVIQKRTGATATAPA